MRKIGGQSGMRAGGRKPHPGNRVASEVRSSLGIRHRQQCGLKVPAAHFFEEPAVFDFVGCLGGAGGGTIGTGFCQRDHTGEAIFFGFVPGGEASHALGVNSRILRIYIGHS